MGTARNRWIGSRLQRTPRDTGAQRRRSPDNRRDETVRVFAAMEPYGRETLGVVFCRDMAESTWGWNMEGGRLKLNSVRRSRHTGKSLNQKDMFRAMFRAFYPDIDPTGFDLRDSDVIEDRPAAE